MKRVKRRYFPKQKPPRSSLEGYMDGAASAKSDPGPRPIVPRIFLSIFAIAIIGYVLTHDGVRIDVEVDLSNWQDGTTQSGPAAKNAHMNVVAGALMHELTRQGVFPESVKIDKSTISITAPKAPITGMRLADMVENIKDCHVGAFEWEGSSVDVDMLRNTTSCETLFDGCSTSVDAMGHTRLNIVLTPDGRNHFANFQDTMVFVKAAYPIAMIDDYLLEDNGNLVLKSGTGTPEAQQSELSRVCDAMQNRDQLEGVAFKRITTHRIGMNLF